MNKPINTAELKPAVTTGPLPASRKIFVTPDEAPDVRVPLREIILSEGAGEPNLPVYDTSGPYTDPTVVIDVNAGLPRNRIAWVRERGGASRFRPEVLVRKHRFLGILDDHRSLQRGLMAGVAGISQMAKVLGKLGFILVLDGVVQLE